MTHTLVVRLDSLGDVLVCGPAIRALANTSDRLTMLAGPAGAAAARLLPGVDDVLVWHCPWIDLTAPPLAETGIDDVVARVRATGADRAVVLTSFHQSALPTALVLHLAGVTDVTAVSTDFPGSLLTRRLPEPGDAPEPVRMLQVARAAGGELPPGDDGRLRVTGLVRPAAAPTRPYAVVHPGVTAPARAYPRDHWARVVRELGAAGLEVVVTGSAGEADLVEAVAAGSPDATAAGALDLPRLAGLLAGASVVLAANTGPAHLAAAVGTPVVSLFAPVVPAVRWAPHGVAVSLLGDQSAACAGTRARECPLPGHPCLTGVAPATVAAEALRLAVAAGRTPRPAGERVPV